MNIGIVTQYTHSVVTQAALQLAHHFLHDRGDTVSILTPTEKPAQVSYYWNKHVVTLDSLPAGRGFMTWFEATKPAVVIWTSVPRPEQIEYVNEKAMSVCLATLLGTDKEILAAYPVFSRLVAPSQCIADLLALDSAFSELALNHLGICPWSPFSTCTCLDENKPPVWPPRIYVRLAQVPKISRDLIDLLDRLLSKTGITLSVGCRDRKQFPTRQRKKFTKFRKRFNAYIVGDQSAEQVRLSQHNYTVSLDPVDPFGMTALCAMHAGSIPVVAKSPPYQEFITDTSNGVLLPPQHLTQDFAKLEAALLELVAYPEFYLQVQAKLSLSLLERREVWENFWDQLLTPVE